METAENQNKNQWLLGVIAILVLALIIETGILLNAVRKNKQSEKAVPAQSYAIDKTAAAPGGLAAAPSPFKSNVTRPSRSQASQVWNDDMANDPFAALERIQERMNRLFDTAMIYGPPAAQHFLGDGAFDFTPAIDIQETGSAYIVTGDLPGLDKEKINITVRGETLTIEGVRDDVKQKQDPQSGFYSQERSYGSFSRILTLPGPVDETKVQAQYQNGVLKLTLPKAQNTKTSQKVAIQ
jgi:HSP20 family protein